MKRDTLIDFFNYFLKHMAISSVYPTRASKPHLYLCRSRWAACVALLHGSTEQGLVRGDKVIFFSG